jgi:hypothetical protein
MDRREVLGGGVLAGVLGALNAEESAQASQRRPEAADVGQIVDAIDKLRDTVAGLRGFPEIGSIRDAQRTFLRANLKMPDFIEVGAGPWFSLYDWHVRWQQQLNLGRDAQGRYTILFLGTTVILRADSPDAFMSLPYDVR